ncbi:DNA methyltransferase [Mycobacterium phage Estave1]|uniref:Cytosine-specific methyltransferase n=2 Tax=root TaxID=1 RepID=A0A088F6E9_9CAUD|nr:DNA methyltransferase [Mycobacterium phage Estave1]AIM40465.1 DNA methyltransferase [Mycobacterium phage Estave1]
MKIGSICSGAAGLDLAVEQVFSAHTVWHCEVDTAASKVLAHHYPGVPNHGDITTINWDTVEPVDILCGGYPCQPFSHAGQRKGTNDERHIWPYVREAIRRVRPRYTVLENVAGHRSLGFDRVLGDLAEDGLHVRWTSIRASDIGAPHQRERVFLFVTAPAGECRENIVRGCNAEGLAIVPESGAGDRNCRRPVAAGIQRLGRTADELAAVDLLPTPSAADGGGGHLTRSGDRSHELLLPGVARAYSRGELLSTPQARDYKGIPADGFNVANLCRDVADEQNWGKYAKAIHRWELMTRTSPAPTQQSRNGNPRLAAAFPEWMMGWPAGWVTEVPGISRNDQLRIIGNGVVPQQAAAALRWLLSIEVAA